MFIAHNRAVLWTNSHPRKVRFFQLPLLVLRHVRIMVHDVFMRGEEEPAGAACRIADGFSGLRRYDIDDRLRSEDAA